VKKTDTKSFPMRLVSTLLFLLVWHIAAILIDNKLLLTGPIETLAALFRMAGEPEFWSIAASSSLKIALSFILAFVVAQLLALLASSYPVAESLLRPYMLTIKSVPVVSFIVLALLWLSSKRISTFISFLMILPVLYQNSLQGFHSADKGLLELAQVSKMSRVNKVRLIYIPALKPYVVSASRSALGISWKSGIAAEVIGVSPNSIGGMLYQAKINLEIPELFAWTVVIVILSTCFEKLAMVLIKHCFSRLEVPKWTSC